MFTVGDIIVFEQTFYAIGRMIEWNEAAGYFVIEKPFVIQMTDYRELPPHIQEQVKNNPNALPIGFAPYPPFFEGNIRINIGQCKSIGKPQKSISSLYVQHTSNIILPTMGKKHVL